MKKFLFTLVMAAAVLTGCDSLRNNPLVNQGKTPYGTAEFSKIKMEHYMPAFDHALAEARTEMDAIINNPEEPSPKNTIITI